MLTLAIETATRTCSTALADGDRAIGAFTSTGDTHHSARLMEMVDALLSASGIRRKDLEAVAISAGPGSFTGLRIGMGTAKGICLGGDLPLVPVSTLAGIAYRAACVRVPICALLDARRGDVYAGVYRADGSGALQGVLEDRAAALDGFLKLLPSEPVLFTGEGAEVYRKQIAALRADPDFAPASLGVPCASSIAVLGARAAAAGLGMHADGMEPEYLRRSQAERLRDAGPRE